MSTFMSTFAVPIAIGAVAGVRDQVDLNVNVRPS
jgi:hypothetical protein